MLFESFVMGDCFWASPVQWNAIPGNKGVSDGYIHRHSPCGPS